MHNSKKKTVLITGLIIIFIGLLVLLTSQFIVAEEKVPKVSGFEQLKRIDSKLEIALEEKEPVIDNNRDIVKAEAQNKVSEMGEKEKIKFKMLNASSFYDAIEGRYSKFYQYFDSMGDKTGEEYNETVEFKLDYQNIQGVEVSSLGNTVIIDDKVEISTNGNGGLTKRVNNAYVMEVGKVNNTEETEQENREMILNIDRKFLSPQTFVVEAIDIIEPQQKAIYLLDDGNEWNIISETSIFGRDACIIEGKINNSGKGDNQTSFKLIVDKNTGVIFESAIYDLNGVTTYSEKVEEIKILENTYKEKVVDSSVLEQGYNSLFENDKNKNMLKNSIMVEQPLISDETIDFYNS